MNLFRENQRASAGLIGIFLTFWLTLFGLHCFAETMPATPVPVPSGNQAAFSLEGIHAGIPFHECHENCKNVYARNDVAVFKQQLMSFSPESPSLPVALAEYRDSESRDDLSFRVIPSPGGAVLHPLTLNCVQLK